MARASVPDRDVRIGLWAHGPPVTGTVPVPQSDVGAAESDSLARVRPDARTRRLGLDTRQAVRVTDTVKVIQWCLDSGTLSDSLSASVPQERELIT